MEALRISTEARMRLRQSATCTVHSAYRSTVNLMTKDNGLVCLTSRSVPLHPFSVVVDVAEIERLGLSPRLGVVVANNALLLPSGEMLDISAQRSEDLSVIPWVGRRINRVAMAQVRSLIENACSASPLGFLVSAGVRTDLAPFADRIERFAQAARYAEVANASAFAYDLVGLGWGLTPSMDDFCVGMLGALWRRGSVQAARQLGSTLALRAQDASTLVSQQFLHFAARGRFGKTLLEVLANLEDDDEARLSSAMAKLFSMGHSSGIDTALGLAVGLGLTDSSIGATPSVSAKERDAMP